MGQGGREVHWLPREEIGLGAGEWLCSAGRSLTFFGPQRPLHIMDWGVGLRNLELRLLVFAVEYGLSSSFVPRTQQ